MAFLVNRAANWYKEQISAWLLMAKESCVRTFTLSIGVTVLVQEMLPGFRPAGAIACG